MTNINTKAATVLGLSLIIGLSALGFLVQQMAVKFKEYERVVAVKGLSEREVVADTVIWPIQFTVADNQLSSLFATVDQQTQLITQFLVEKAWIAQRFPFSTCCDR